MQIRREEDMLFKKMALPPVVLEGVHDVLDLSAQDANTEKIIRESRKRKVNDSTKVKRPRGRPKKKIS